MYALLYAFILIPFLSPWFVSSGPTMVYQGSWDYLNTVSFSGNLEASCIDASGATTKGILASDSGTSFVDFESGVEHAASTVTLVSACIVDTQLPGIDHGRMVISSSSAVEQGPSATIRLLKLGGATGPVSTDKTTAYNSPTLTGGKIVYQLVPTQIVYQHGSNDFWMLIRYQYLDTTYFWGTAIYKFNVNWGTDSPIAQGNIVNSYQFVSAEALGYYSRNTLGIFTSNVIGVGTTSDSIVHSIQRTNPASNTPTDFSFGANQIMSTATDLDKFFVLFTRHGLRISGKFTTWNQAATSLDVAYIDTPFFSSYIDPQTGILWATGFNGVLTKFRTSDLSIFESNTTTIPLSGLLNVDDDVNNEFLYDYTLFSPRQNRVYVLTHNSSVPSYAFTLENCAAQSECDTCISDPTCAWCATEKLCKQNDKINTCAGNGWRHENDNPNACSALVSALSPSSIPAISGTVTFTGLFFDSISPLPNCTIGGLEGTVNVISPTALECTVSNLTTLVNPSEFSTQTAEIQYQSAPYGPSYPTDVYNCQFYPDDSCTSCSTAPCQYSVAFGTCDYIGGNPNCSTSTCVTSASNCPVLSSVSPDSAQVGEQPTLTIKSNGIFYDDVSCFFGGTLTTLIPATYVDPSTITCIPPDSPVTQIVPLSIRDNSNNRSLTPSTLTFEFFSCEVFGSNCSTCINQYHPNCFFCLQTQLCGTVGTDSCQGNHFVTNQNCPSIASVTPNPQFANNNTIYFVFGNDFTPVGSYECKFTDPNAIGAPNSTIPATRVSDTSLTCDTLVQSTGLGYSALQIMYNTTVEYTPPNELLHFVTCSNFLTCSTCQSDGPAGCGWCPEQAICATSSTCPSLHTSQCAVIESVNPSADAVSGGSNLTVTSSISHGTTFDLSCLFVQGSQSYLANATSLNELEGTFFCESPAFGAGGTWNLSLTLRNTTTQFASPTSLSIIECPPEYLASDCPTCFEYPESRPGPCGYCLDHDSCSLPHKCSIAWVENDCPFATINPIQSPLKGGGVITFTGIFSDVPSYYCKFESLQTFEETATFVSTSTITCPIPDVSAVALGSSQVYSISLYHNDVLYQSGITFLFQDKIVVASIPEDDPTSAILFPILAGVILLVGAYYRHKYANSDTVELKLQALEPLVFGKLAKPIYSLGPEQTEAIQDLDKLVFSRGFGGQSFPVIEIILSITGVSESDKICKAIIFCAQKHKLTASVCSAIIEEELASHYESHKSDPLDARATLFRTNSHSTKLVKYLSRLVGIPYLWDSLASVLYDIITTTSSSSTSIAAADDAANANTKKTPDDDGDVSLTITRNKIESSNLEMNRDNSQAQYEAALQLELFCTKIFNRIANSIPKIPLPLRVVYSKVAEEVSKYYPDCTNKALGGFFFLRFLTPAISTPEAYGINPTGEPIQRETRRSLVLVAKVLQNLANQVEFGRKEQFMVKMNRFIQDNIPNLAEFYNKLVDSSSDIGAADSYVGPCVPDEIVHTNCLVEICDHLIVNRNRVIPLIQEKYGQSGNHFVDGMNKLFKAFDNSRPTKLSS